MFTTTTYGPAARTVFGLLLAAACVWDLRARRIPNWLAAAIAVTGLVFGALAASGVRGVLGGVLAGLGGLAVGFALWIPFYALRMLGAGDVKFFAAASAWLGASLALRAALLSAVLGGALALVWLALFGGWRHAAANVALQVAHPTMRLPAAAPARANKIPYGVAMACGLAAAACFPHLIW